MTNKMALKIESIVFLFLCQKDLILFMFRITLIYLVKSTNIVSKIKKDL